MISRRILTWLVTVALVLPIALSIVAAAARLLAAMQDQAGAAALDRGCLVLGIVWLVDLVCLVIALGLTLLTVAGDRDPGYSDPDDSDSGEVVRPNRRPPTDDVR